MKKLAIPMACMIVGLTLGLAAGCANTGIKHISADKFIREAKTMEQMNSASGTFYIGASSTRAYVERSGLYKLFACHEAIVYWTELENLPVEMVDQLRTGTPPWRPWYEKAKGKDNKVLENIGTNAPNSQH
jgi:hypothetical protein